MKQLNLLYASLFGLLALFSCKNEVAEIEQETEQAVRAPRLTATIEGVETRAGVIEDNPYYATTGEKFYWEAGDAVSVTFTGTGGEGPFTAVYLAQVEGGVKSNTCTLAISGMFDAEDVGSVSELPEGDYTVTAVYGSETVPAMQEQPDDTSSHLSSGFYMTASGVYNTSDSELDLGFSHHTAVFRFSVWNDTGNSNLKLRQVNVSTVLAVNAFETTSGTIAQIGLKLTDGSFVADGESRPVCDGFMAAPATEAFTGEGDGLKVTLLLEDATTTPNATGYTLTKILPFSGGGSFLAGGIESGKSYYFKLKVNDPDLIAYRKVSAGTFQMGSPSTESGRYSDETQHSVTLTQNFYMGRYEVTKEQYCAFLNAAGIANVDGETSAITGTVNGHGTQTLFVKNQWGWTPVWDSGTGKWVTIGTEGTPMIYVTWYGAKAFADWAGASLPTEAQWEYACRAGTATAFSYGATADGDYMWYNGNSVSGPSPVGTKLPNPWSLYDMHGNAIEWCLDEWDGSTAYPSDPVTDPLGTSGAYRVLRGGSAFSSGRNSRSAFRFNGSPYNEGSILYGFRVAFVP